MEALVNLLVPVDERLPHVTTTDIVRNNLLDKGTLLTEYTYGTATYTSLSEAVAANTAFKVNTYGLDPTKVTPKIVAEKMELILNPPTDYEDGDLFDVDVVNPEDMKHHWSHYGYYVHKDMYLKSCPHNDPTHHRTQENGLVSCDPNQLRAYSQLVSWHNDNKARLPYRNVDKHDVPVTLYDHDDQAWISEIINEAIEFYHNIQPFAVFTEYKHGVDLHYNINSLTRNRLWYDYRNGQWEPAVNIDNMGLIKYKETALNSVLNLSKAHIAKVPLPMTDIVKVSYENRLISFSQSDLDIKLRQYFDGLGMYRTHTFNIDIGWVPSNTVHTVPQVTIDDNKHTDKIDEFCKVVDYINHLNA
jgi:hypothetical protein